MRFFTHSLFVLFVSFVVKTAAAEDRDDPAVEQASFKLAPGFEVNLWASEKEGVVKPIQMRWDERGRLWVIGSSTYPQIKPGEEPNDKVLIWYGRSGRLRYAIHVRSVATDENGNPIGEVVSDESEVLQSLTVAR